MDLKATLHLPDPAATLPMKADLPNLEPRVQARWNEGEGIYARIQAARADQPVFTLHDGPPYTNGPIHEGTALNKILKDFVLKTRGAMGFRAPYVPGFDNHGLPIEQAVQRKLREAKVEFDDDRLRRECRRHAQEFIEVQTTQFRRLGVFGLWDRPYRTMDPRMEAGVVRIFGRLAERGLVYRGLRPTLWSPTMRTSLADADTYYREDHVSRAIYVAFPLKSDPDGALGGLSPKAVIWTTTPWTIPANLALAFHPEFEYAVVDGGGGTVPVPGPGGILPPASAADLEQDAPGTREQDAPTTRGGTILVPDSADLEQDAPATGERDAPTTTYLVALDLLPKLAALFGWAEPRVLRTLKGREIENAVFAHPIFGRDSRAVLADYVTAEDGTGIVHTAPSHGRDDFLTGQRYGLPVPNTVDEAGRLTAETGEFAGVNWKECDEVVVRRLKEEGALLHFSDFAHSYPYADRDDKPVIFRATEQWFVRVDPLRARMLEEVDGVDWFPASGETRISAMVRGRPDWCVSRQRPWGVGIPVFYGAESGTPVFDPVAIEAIARLVEEHGSESWFTTPTEAILPPGYAHPETGETAFRKETDVFDVWFDAGSTSLNVLADPVYPEWPQGFPADLYLEGSDQHRGWFNVSLILATGARDAAPYRQVVTHGFVTDESGRKISKRLGNGVDPIKTCETYGADVLRLWAASVKWEDDVPIGANLLKQAGEVYRDLRNALRFALSVAADGEPGGTDLDAWTLDRLDDLQRAVVGHWERYAFGDALREVHGFCRDTLSKFFFDAIKDRVYCDAPDSARRRSAQATCRVVAERLTVLLAPTIPHTAEEAWDYLGHGETVFAASLPALPDAPRTDRARFDRLLAVRDEVNAAFEAYKGTDGIKNPQAASLTLPALPEGFDADDLANYLRVSEVRAGGALGFAPSPWPECARSRLRRPDVAPREVEGETILLTDRDLAAVTAYLGKG